MLAVTAVEYSNGIDAATGSSTARYRAPQTTASTATSAETPTRTRF